MMSYQRVNKIRYNYSKSYKQIENSGGGGERTFMERRMNIRDIRDEREKGGTT